MADPFVIETVELRKRGENYFRTGTLPWTGLVISAVAAGGMLYAGSRNFARQDF